jgi:hypothetical protein
LRLRAPLPWLPSAEWQTGWLADWHWQLSWHALLRQILFWRVLRCQQSWSTSNFHKQFIQFIHFISGFKEYPGGLASLPAMAGSNRGVVCRV